MLFTTASTPFNPYVKRRLHQLMTIWEKEYYALRLHYIQLHFPALSCRSERSCTKDARTYLPTYPQGCQDRFLSSIERCFQHLRSTKRELDRTHLTHRNISLAGKTFRLSSPDRKRFLQHGSLQPDLHIHLLRYQRSDQDQRKSWFPICPVYNPAPTER